MQLDFFPSRTLTLYLAKLFVARIAAMLFVLVLGVTVVQIIGQKRWVTYA